MLKNNGKRVQDRRSGRTQGPLALSLLLPPGGRDSVPRLMLQLCSSSLRVPRGKAGGAARPESVPGQASHVNEVIRPFAHSLLERLSSRLATVGETVNV